MTERFFSVLRFFIKTAALCHICLVTQNGLYSPGLCSFIKFYGAEHVAVISQGKGRHLQLDCLVYEVMNFARPVKEAVLAVDVKVNKSIFTHDFSFALESPLLGGDLGVGKSVIREIFTEISCPCDPPPPTRGIICTIIKYADLS